VRLAHQPVTLFFKGVIQQRCVEPVGQEHTLRIATAGHQPQRQNTQGMNLNPIPARGAVLRHWLLQPPGTDDRPIQQTDADQLGPLVRFAELRRNRLQQRFPEQQALVQGVCADPQHTFHQTVSAAGETQLVQACIAAMATGL
jgi:hypothetical protein